MLNPRPRRTVTSSELNAVRHLPQFPEQAEVLILVAGVEAAARLISAWGKQEWSVPVKPGGVTRAGIMQYARLEEIVGGQAAARIVKHWAGQRLYIPACEEAFEYLDRDLARAEFDRLTLKEGFSSPEAVSEISFLLNVSNRAVERWLAEPDSPPLPDPAQRGLF